MDTENNKYAKTNTFYVNNFYSLAAKFLRQKFSIDSQITCALMRWVST